MSEQELPPAVERVLQQFEAMAPAEDWRLGGAGMRGIPAGALALRCGTGACPLVWMAFGSALPYDSTALPYDSTSRAGEAFGLSDEETRWIANGADGFGTSAVRARLLAAAGLA